MRRHLVKMPDHYLEDRPAALVLDADDNSVFLGIKRGSGQRQTWRFLEQLARIARV